MRKNSGNLLITTPTEREIVMTRVFAAPRELVWDAWTKPELLVRWLGVFDGWTLAVCEVDLRVGGTCRFVWRGPHGEAMGMRTVYSEIVAPERIVGTETFDEAWYDGNALSTLVFTELGGKTTLTNTVLYSSKAVRDAVLKTPMEHGVAASYDNLEKILPSR